MQKKEDSDKVVRIFNIVKNELSVFQTEFDEYEDGYNYLAGEQYKPRVKEWWKTQRRPARAFNLIFPMFNRTIGEILLNDENMKVYPLPGGTPDIAFTLNELLLHSNQDNDHKFVLANWAIAGLIKRGFAYVRFSDEKHIDGSIVFTPLDEFEVLFDHRAQNYFLDDAAYVIRQRWMTTDQILATWPHHKSELKQILHDREQAEFWGSLDPEIISMMDHSDFVDEKDGKYRVVEFHEFEYEDAEVAYNPLTGEAEIWSLEGRKADLYLKIHPEVKIIPRKNQKIKKITTVIPGLNFLLEEKKADLQDQQFDIVPFSAYTYSKYVINNFGIFRNAREPQDSFNEWRNESEAILKKAADPGYTYDPSKLQNPQDIENFGRRPGQNFRLHEGERPDEAMKLNEIPKLPFAPDQKMQEDVEFLQKITGITANLEGLSQTQQENASLFAQRVHEARKSMQILFQNWVRSKRRIYRKHLRLMQENYTTERYFLITTPDPNTGALRQRELIINQRVGNQILNNITVGRYDVFIDEANRNPTEKMIRFIQKTEVAQLIAQWFGPQAVDPEWWLSDANLGDIQKVIDRINMILAQQGIQAQQDEAFQITGALQDLAKKQLELESSAGLPAQMQAQQQNTNK